MTDTALDERHEIGGNDPPEPTAFEMYSEEIKGLYGEAKLWLDGDPIDSQDMANGVTDLRNAIFKARKGADTERKAEVKPLNDAKTEIQARYNPLLKQADMAKDACNKALAPFLLKQANEKREIEARAKWEVEEKERKAQDAIRASNPENLAEREAAEELVTEAKQAGIAAKAAAKDKAKSGTTGRSAHLRTTYTPVITDAIAAIRHYWPEHQDEIEVVLLALARNDIARGIRNIPGFEVKEVQTVV